MDRTLGVGHGQSPGHRCRLKQVRISHTCSCRDAHRGGPTREVTLTVLASWGVHLVCLNQSCPCCLFTRASLTPSSVSLCLQDSLLPADTIPDNYSLLISWCLLPLAHALHLSPGTSSSITACKVLRAPVRRESSCCWTEARDSLRGGCAPPPHNSPPPRRGPGASA